VFDINRDGYQDILFANYYNGSSYNINSYIYWGFAGGYSTSNRTELPGQGVYGAAIADFNKDGHYDIVFANYTNGTSAYINSYIYWGSDTGYSSTNRKELPTHYAHAVSAGDLNSDGWIDIVFCNLREQNTYFTYSAIYWGSENGFSVADTTDLETNRAFGSTLSDLNNDGYVDIVFSNMSSDSSYATNSYIYWGSYSGYNNYNRTMTPNNGATNNCVADINRDGYLDIIFSNYYNGSTYSLNSNIYWGTESYSYVLRSGLPTNGAYGGAVADLNKDGYMDFVFANGMEGANQNTNSYIYWGSPSGISIANRTLLPTCAARGVSAGNISAFTQNSIQSYLDTQFEVNRLRYGYEESYQGYIKLVSYTVAGKSIKRSRIYTPSGQWVSLTTDSAKKKAGLTEQGMVFSQAQAKWNNGEYYLKTYFTDGDILVKTFKKYSKQYPAWVDMIYPVHKCKTPVSFNIRWTGDITALEVYQLPENIKVAGVDSNLAGITSYNLAEGTLQTGKEYVAHVYRNSGPPYYSGSVTATQFKVETSDDWDCDGMPNNWETEHSLDPFNPFDALLDPDNDGLDNITEFQHQTSPQSSDTDLDAIPDGFEIQNGLNPLVSNENTDSDNDGLSDSLEYSINTLIFNPDTDSDGMSDGNEYYAGFDPKDSQSVFVVKSVNTQPAGAGFKLSWPASSASNAVYHIYYKESSSGIWVELQINQQDITTNPDGSKSYVDNSLQGFASGIKTRLYRVTITRQ